MEIVFWFLCASALLLKTAFGGNVTYDGRSLIIDGEHRMLFAGSIHYPRSTPEMWPDLIAKAKDNGIDVIQTYVFWNQHEPQQGQYDFSGRRDLVKFIKTIQAQGLYVCLRIGPFIESEWTYGGFPIWLRDVPNIEFRTNNEPFEYYMQRFTTKIVDMMKNENLFAPQGGPIILSQIENEYTLVEGAYHEQGPVYVRWVADMAVKQNTGVPWIMCRQPDAPDPVINSCNGMRCGDSFAGPNKPYKPSLWTENWTNAYEAYGDEPKFRAVEDIAYQVALFITAKNGSYVNYYMFHGGTNFGKTASAYVLTSYYDQAPLDEYGLIREPKYAHLKELHAAVKLCTKPLLYGTRTTFPLGQFQQVQAYEYKVKSGECAAFLVNSQNGNASVQYQNQSYELPGKSVSILPDCKNVAFNTAKVNAQYGTRSVRTSQKLDSVANWQEYKETVPEFDQTSIRSNTFLEQMNTTKAKTDYLWYNFRYEHNSLDSQVNLDVTTLGHVLHAFINGDLQGSAHGSLKTRGFSLAENVTLRNGDNSISILSAMVGLPDGGGYMERRVAGLRRARIQGQDFSRNQWGYQIGLLGEQQEVYTDSGSSNVQWNSLESSNHQPLTWYKTQFDAPAGNDPVAINLGSMGKGEVWINGESIGRYWISFRNPERNPSQQWYHIPRSFLRPTGNLLVLFEEETGNPLEISMDTISVNKVCGHVSETHYPPVYTWVGRKNQDNKSFWDTHHHRSGLQVVQLQCPGGSKIANILFSSYGTPSGDCGSYALGNCHAPRSKSIVEKACLGKVRCSIPVSNRHFGGDPCRNVTKSLIVDARCT